MKPEWSGVPIWRRAAADPGADTEETLRLCSGVAGCIWCTLPGAEILGLLSPGDGALLIRLNSTPSISVRSAPRACTHLGAGFLFLPKKLSLSLLSMLGLPRLWLIDPVDSRLVMAELGVTGLFGTLEIDVPWTGVCV